MASHFWVGVSQSARSTPAVRLPWFSVTRLTASALAENEWFNDRCRVFTRRQSLSSVAFAIRCCVVLTCRSTRRQSMACQSRGSREDAEPLSLEAFLMLSSLVESLGGRTCPRRDSFVPSEWLELIQPSATVAPCGSLRAFAPEQILNPYAADYRRPFAFSTIPYPLTQQLALRLACPFPKTWADGGAYHVP